MPHRRPHVSAPWRAASVLCAAMLVGTATAAAAAPVAPVARTTAAPTPQEDDGGRSALGLGEHPSAAEAPAPPSADRVLVRFAPRVDTSDRRRALADAGARSAGTICGTGFVAVETAPGEADAVAAELDADPQVEAVQVDHVRSAYSLAPWELDTYWGSARPYLDLLRLPAGWTAADGSGATIAVLDTAVRTSHRELAGAVLPGVDIVDGDDDPAASEWHGTMVASIAAARADGSGIAGAAYRSSILPVRVLDGAGYGTDSDVAEGLDWASSHGADVINLSLGGPQPSPVLEAALRTAVARGSVVVIAAGNTGRESLEYPAAYAADIPGVLSVSATEDDGRLLEGGQTGSTWNDAVSLAAPGFEIIGAGRADDEDYDVGTGTSFAAPFVSGAAALLVQRHPAWTPEQVARHLRATARDAGPRGNDPFYGAGILDVGAALAQVAATPLDRTGDDGPSDDLPATARTVTVGTEFDVRLHAEGDVDWVRFDTVAGARYSWYNRDDAPVTAVVLDAEGRQTATGGTSGSFTSYRGGPVYVGFRSPTSTRSRSAQFGWSTWADLRVTIRRGVDVDPRDLAFAKGTATGSALPDGRNPTFADVTGDGITDVVTDARTYVPGEGLPGLVVLAAGRADGGLTAAGSVKVPTSTLGASHVVADIDGDGVAEVVAAGDTQVNAFSARGGSWSAPRLLATGPSFGSLDAADTDGDGDTDIVVGGRTLTVLRNDGDGAFTVVPASTTQLGGPVVLDVDGQGLPDIVTSTGATLLQTAPGTYEAGQPIPGLTGPLRRVQVDGDGRDDVLALSDASARTETTVWHGSPGGGLERPQKAITYSDDHSHPVLSDVDGDGLLDLVTTDWFALQEADGSFHEQQLSPADVERSSGWSVARDVLGDARPDVVIYPSGKVYEQIDAEPAPGPGTWVWGVSPADEANGASATPDVVVTSRRALDPEQPDGAVRLIASDGAEVATDLRTDTTAGTVTVVPRAPLPVGGHYQVRVTGLRDAAGDVMAETVRSWFTVGAAGQRFTPLEPYRVLDTRENGHGFLRPGAPLDLHLRDVPPDATSVVLNVTAASPQNAGFLRVFPEPSSGEPAEPDVSNLNLAPGIDQPNLVTVKLGDYRSVRFSAVWVTTHVVVDIAGYYSPGGATAYSPVEPRRVMDLRTGENGGPRGILRAQTWVDLQVTGRNGVPADATSVVLNVTGANPPGRTVVRVFPTPAPYEHDALPSVSNLNLMPGRDQPNLVTVRVGWGGKVRFFSHASDVMLVADVAGYYAPTATDGFTALDPVRVADTRTGLGVPGGRMFPATTRTLTVAGVAGVPANATAAAFNVTGAKPGYLTNVRVFPRRDAPPPSISNLNLVPGRDEPNMVIARIGDEGGVSFYNHSAMLDLVVDLNGYFSTWAPPAP